MLDVVQPLMHAGFSRQPWTVGARADGGVMIEWRGPGGALEVHIEPDGSFGFLFEDGRFGDREANNVSLDELTQLLKQTLG